MKTRQHKHGLSLVEMLIVVGVIALLATMVISVAGRIDAQAKENAVKNLFAVLEGALEEYKDFIGEFPRAMNTDPYMNSEILYERLNEVSVSRKILEKISGSLIQNKYSPVGVSLDESPPEIYDPWGTVLYYRYAAGDNFPELVSAGPDRKFGTVDDITNK
jgi:prepilin-type N-terminal cleavage/methylation domain-containing protein